MSSVLEKARAAREASLELAKLDSETKNRALEHVARNIEERFEEILEANTLDLEKAEKLVKKGRLSKALYKRLQLSEDKIFGIAESVKSVAGLEDPVGKTVSKTELDEGLVLTKVTVPIGVIGAVFESRPDVVPQIGSLCLKSGNAVLMKGGSEAKHSNRMLYGLIEEASVSEGVPEGWIQLLETREDVKKMLELDEYVSLLVPRGSNEFVKYIQDNTRIPVLGHSSGVCHVYVHKDADLEMAEKIVFDAKCQYPAVCNAMETLLVDGKIAGVFLKKIGARFDEAGVEVKGDERACKIIGKARRACESDWGSEYNDLVLNVKVVSGVGEAVDRINRYGSGHTDAIVTGNRAAAEYFIESVDSSSVMWNASTRFSDGFRYGLGAEVGISTNKVHARGPVGLAGLVIYKWVLRGGGHVVADYVGRDARVFRHRRL
jgi:glutamate-5-semialdehyde dehydrogenase